MPNHSRNASKLFSSLGSKVGPALVPVLVISATASASLPRDEYLSGLSLAQHKVERLKEFRSRKAALRAGTVAASGEALTASALKGLLGRFYQVGDQWDVIAFHVDDTAARATSDPALLANPPGRSGVFHYEVLSAQDGADGQVVLRVTQKSDLGLRITDPAVQSMLLSMSDGFQQTRKQYRRSSGATVEASPDGLHSSASVLELYPLDIPDIVSAEKLTPASLPALPDPLAPLARTSGFAPDLERCSWFEQDDFFGRPVQVLWQQGDPWPAYLKTPGGVAILIHKDLSAEPRIAR